MEQKRDAIGKNVEKSFHLRNKAETGCDSRALPSQRFSEVDLLP